MVMSEINKEAADQIQVELCTLGGALRGLGLCMGSVAMERSEMSISHRHDEEMSYIVECLGRYAERLANELDLALVEVKK